MFPLSSGWLSFPHTQFFFFALIAANPYTSLFNMVQIKLSESVVFIVAAAAIPPFQVVALPVRTYAGVLAVQDLNASYTAIKATLPTETGTVDPKLL